MPHKKFAIQSVTNFESIWYYYTTGSALDTILRFAEKFALNIYDISTTQGRFRSNAGAFIIKRVWD